MFRNALILMQVCLFVPLESAILNYLAASIAQNEVSAGLSGSRSAAECEASHIHLRAAGQKGGHQWKYTNRGFALTSVMGTTSAPSFGNTA